MQQQAERFGAGTKYAEVLKLELEGNIKSVHTNEGSYKAKSVVISTGANPRQLGVARENEMIGRGLGYCAHCDGMFYKGKTVVVAGGGNSAAADALLLSRICKKVIVVHRRDTLRATKVYHEPLSKAENVEFLWNSQVSGIRADSRLRSLEITNLATGEVTQLEVDGLFVSIGRKPATELVKCQLELDEAGYIVADETTRTNIPGVFAVGDVRTKALRQVVTATADGAVAAHFADEYLASIK
jgi:thioredoxin reductase (NADPH)